MKAARKTLFVAVIASVATSALCNAESVSSDVKPVGVIGKPSGTGEYPAVAVSDASMRENTLYLPEKMPDQAMPLLLWGNGGCRDNGLRYTQFLREIASHGFFIVASGYPRFERELVPPGTPKVEGPDPVSELPDTTPDQLIAAMDWAAARNADPDSPYHGKIDMDNIGVFGTSCGGLQTITVSADERIKTSIVFNSGVFSEAPERDPVNINLIVDKGALEKIHSPVAYINGGESDIAYENAVDDYERIDHVPIFFGENGVGHGGTYLFDENGGEYAQVATAWMSWQLKDEEQAATWFQGEECRLCVKEGWKVMKKGID